MQAPLSVSAEKNLSALTPATDNSLNVASNNTVHSPTSTLAPTSRKRKSSELDNDGRGPSASAEVFTANILSSTKSAGSSSGVGTVTFAPVTLVARACLPLTWLDCSSPTARLIFQAEITAVVVEEWEQRVLVVRRLPSGTLFAVEKVASTPVATFVACALHDWVTEAWCHDAGIGKIASVRVEDLLSGGGNEDAYANTYTYTHPGTHSRTVSGSSSAALPIATTGLSSSKGPKRPNNRRGALARMSILALKDPAATLGAMEGVISPSIQQQESQQPIDPNVQERASAGSSPAVLQMPGMAHSPDQAALPITPAAQISTQNPFEASLAATEAGAPQEMPSTLRGAGIQEPQPSILGETGIQEPQPVVAVGLEAGVHNVLPDTNPLAPERVRAQYFEHLYTSKTSLAFYVKGPLSRARAHVRTAEHPIRAIRELSDFYEQSILPTKKVDTKYKESIVKIIGELPLPQQEGEPDGPGVDMKKRKSRKTKTVMKRGKDCLWPQEEDFIAKWWRGRDIRGPVSASDRTEEVRKEVADLRMRETKMQMLLMLEVMLLDTAASTLAGSESEVPPVPADPDIKVESVEEESSAALLAMTPRKQSKKEKKKRDWAAEIDTIVDRLCIWHTVSLDDLVNTANDKALKKDANGSSASKPNDSLRDFCKEVLLPFYSAKLSEQIKAICRKLGGPDITPKRPRLGHTAPRLHRSSSSVSSSTKSKPGQPLSTRTLERVLSEDHQLLRHASPPTTFSRASSITAPSIPTLKREPSDRPASRGRMLAKSMSFSNREIDLVADQRVHEAKRRKLDRLAQQKKELEAAIDALKKPDRRAVASQFMDEAEQRKRLEMDKKTAVQISATPRAKRVQGHSQLLGEPELPPMPMPRLVSRGQDATMVIPSSTVKPRIRPGLSSSASIPRSSAKKQAVLAAIHETPSRGLDKKTSNPLDLAVLSHPLVEPGNDTSIVATPAARRTHPDFGDHVSPGFNLPSSQPLPPSSQMTNPGEGLLMRRSGRPVLFTPLRKSDVRLDQAFRDAPIIPERAGHIMDRVMGGKGRGIDEGFEALPGGHPPGTRNFRAAEQKGTRLDDADDGDIYDKLGWNDDFDL
ncbi:hypothetical protein A1O7_06135 [Cladophialophora yegresii CBS 114405]|uniref:DNA replication regulator Sld3 C-terminal domain-containing protein n=1 Tax=Cladophialophora yegresii CBS 114405 TaxID=1182544 RepID=W9W2G5_9EURO|nr:uncharacterized protein A1O7_06135 [Cladophialophora yegresii CBS 114405]EXJ58706.1 hypothetical protein A1O7_06135 [Cladophialophora yegresii CBS 114405]